MQGRYSWELDIVMAIVTSVSLHYNVSEINVKTGACGGYEIIIKLLHFMMIS